MGKILIIAGAAIAVINTIILMVFAAKPVKYEPTIYSAATAGNPDVFKAGGGKKEKPEQKEVIKTGTKVMGEAKEDRTRVLNEEEKTAVLNSSSLYEDEKTQVLGGTDEEKTAVLHGSMADEDGKNEVLNRYAEEKTEVLHSALSSNTGFEEDEKTRVLGERYDSLMDEAEEATRVLGNDDDKTAILGGKH